MPASDEILKEFLLESWEGLNQLDRDFVELESNPGNRDRLSAIFRCIHTIKGAAGFLALKRLESLAHAGESLLSRLRNGDVVLDALMTSTLLSMVDAIRTILGDLDASGAEGDRSFDPLISQLLALSGDSASAETAVDALADKCASTDHQEPPRTTPADRVAGSSAQVAPPSAADLGEAPPAKGPAVSDAAIRVDVGLLDRVMNLVGELVLARNQILQFGTTVKDIGFSKASQRLNLLTTELQEGVMKTRMQPIGNVWNKFPRVVRDLAQTCGKKVTLDLDGADTELDRTIIEAIKDPLTHAVRNAVDHGVERPEVRRAAGKAEEGRILLRAFHEGGQVNIEISDDGAGIHPEKLRARAVERGLITAERAARMSDRDAVFLIFEAGFSTAEKVTNVSGRGVGMDVVRTNIEKIGGTVDVQTKIGVGTTLKIKIPLTLAIIPALIVNSGDNRFAIPQVSLLELVRLETVNREQAIESMAGTDVYRLRGNLLPLVFLDRALELAVAERRAESVNIVVLQADDRQFGLVVDGISDTEEIVVKPLGKELKGLSCFAGATIMGDGRVALILDVLGIAQKTNVVSASRERAIAEKSSGNQARNEGNDAMLLFRLGRAGRMALPLSMVARLEEIPVANVERAAGRKVVQYRDAILPLIDLSEVLGVGADETPGESLQVIVYCEHGRSVGIVVDQILDTVQERLISRHRSSREGILGSAVIQGRVTDILDVHGVIRCADPALVAQEVS